MKFLKRLFGQEQLRRPLTPPNVPGTSSSPRRPPMSIGEFVRV